MRPSGVACFAPAPLGRNAAEVGDGQRNSAQGAAAVPAAARLITGRADGPQNAGGDRVLFQDLEEESLNNLCLERVSL